MLQSVTYNTPGTYFWPVPPGVSSIRATGVAGGGGASAASSQGGGGGNAGGGGGGGETVDAIAMPVSGVVTVVVGAPGVGGIANGAIPTDGTKTSVDGIVLLPGTANGLIAPPVPNTNSFAAGSGGGCRGVAGQGGASNGAAIGTPGTRNGRHTGGAGGGSGASGTNLAENGQSAAGSAARSIAAGPSHGGGAGANTPYGKGGDGGIQQGVGTNGVGFGSGGGGAGTDLMATPGKDGVGGSATLFWNGNPDGGGVAWNSADRGVDVTLSNGNLTATAAAPGSGTGSVRANVAIDRGKRYWEIRMDTVPFSSDPFLGIRIGNALGTSNGPFGSGGDVGLFAASPNTGHRPYQAGSLVGGGVSPAIALGDVFMFAIDADAHKFWTGRGGVWDYGGNPAAGTGGMPFSAGIWSPWVQTHGVTLTARFDATAWTYAAPAGYSQW